MIFNKVVGSYFRLKCRLFAKYPAINICEQLVRASRVLIYMPSRVEQFGAALKSLERLRELRPGWKITVVTKLEMVSFIDNKLKVEILPYSGEDLTFAGLPKASLKQLVKDATFDLALDFRLKFDVLGIVLFKLSGAPIKVCFDSKEKSPFYNFEIRVHPAESLTNKYNAMIKYITVIAGTECPETSVSGTKAEA